MQQKKQLTPEEREAIALKYKRRILELGIPIFGMPPESELEEYGANVVPFSDPNAETRAAAAERSRAKSQEFLRRIIDATIELSEAAPPPDQGRPHHRKPGDLHRTAERLLAGEVDLPEGFDRVEEAASFDQHAEFEKQKIAFGREMDAVANEAAAGLLPVLMTLLAFAQDVLHVLKAWAQEDPDGPGAGYYRDFNRAWRQSTGRSRGRPRKPVLRWAR